jgi:hypothetical protein
MPGFLDQYGVGEERREKAIKYAALILVAALIIGGGLYFVFKNYREEGRAKRFFELLARHDYTAAYALWGCTEAKPCRDYPMPEFMRDWGPQGQHGNAADFRVTKSRSCGSGVILTVQTGKEEPEKLWVERGSLTLGYSPWPGCPAGR